MSDPVPSSIDNAALSNPERKGTGVRSEGIDKLLEESLFHRKAYERGGRIDEQRRDALLAVRNADGQSLQFIVTLTRGEGGIHTQLEPTHGTLMAYKEAMSRDLTGVTFTSGVQDVRAALNDIIRKLEDAGYSADPVVKVLLMQPQANAGQ